MQTVKINTVDSTIILECESLTIARPNQQMFTSVIEDAKSKGCDKPSLVFVTGGCIEDEQGNFEDNRDIYVNPRLTNDDFGIIGIVVLPSDDKDSICYQFIYEGESVYIMNENGKTIESLKAF